MVFNIVNHFAATITVKFREGRVCSCYSDRTMMTSPGVSGSYVFVVPYAGTWTVTDGTDSETVVITTNGQNVNVNLMMVYLFTSRPSGMGPGDTYEYIGDNKFSIHYYLSGSYDPSEIESMDEINTKGFSKIVMSVDSIQVESDNFRLRFGLGLTGYYEYVSLPTTLSTGIHEYTIPSFERFTDYPVRIALELYPHIEFWQEIILTTAINFTGKIWLE